MKRFWPAYVRVVAAALVALAAAALCGCNAQKNNTAAARQYTAFITRYNIYYNGDKHFRETLEKMEHDYADDYSRTLFMHPIEAKADAKAPQPEGNFDRSIEKAQKAIQVRSIKKKPKRKSGKSDPEYKAWLKRDEYNPFIHNAWMMMGRSQYFNGDFLGAASTFYYITKHFTWLPQTVTEAKIWQAQCYLALDWLYEAETIITRIKPDELTDKSLQERYDFCYADFLIRSREYEKAVPYLQGAISRAKGEQKTRLTFLLGQLYQTLGDRQRAFAMYKKVNGSASANYRTKLNARIKQSEVYTGANYLDEIKALHRMVRYDRNKEYLDQIYYAIGNLYLQHGDTLQAIANYELAAEKSTRSGIEKAISQVTLGGLYFDLRNYEKAQPCYAEAVPLLPETYPDYAQLKRRSDVLDELAGYSQAVNLQDSLLRLAAMPEEERLAAIDGLIAELKRKEKEEAEQAAREEYLAQQQAQGQQQNSNDREFTINSDDSWYFYNASTRNS
ncbi:MAG: tetratricopeptide repeat protein, partial [Muribaculaceae bacterium]|nr:tetratricopeptide repeat protein [Muribaculaceae bacterium]